MQYLCHSKIMGMYCAITLIFYVIFQYLYIINIAFAMDKKLIKVTEYLYKTDYEKPFGFGYKANAYLLLHPKGNIIIYNHSKLTDYSKHIKALGGIKYQYLSHYHEYGNNITKLGEIFNIETYLGNLDFQYIAGINTLKELINNGTKELHKDFYAIYTPGHTRGSNTFIYKKEEDIIIFTGDTLFLGSDNSLDITRAYSWNIDTLKSSIETLRDETSPTLFAPSGSLGTTQYIPINNKSEWEKRINKIFK